MSLDNRPHYSGGCQCGAVRFHVEGKLGDESVCHCRMCQKAFGNFDAPLVSVHRDSKLVWTRGEPKKFRSSNFGLRGDCGDCGDCGTPLSFEAPDGVALAIAAFDEPEEIAPTVQWGLEGKLPYVDHVHELKGYSTEDDPEAADFVNDIVSFQHPDHETETWPPEERK